MWGFVCIVCSQSRGRLSLHLISSASNPLFLPQPSPDFGRFYFCSPQYILFVIRNFAIYWNFLIARVLDVRASSPPTMGLIGNALYYSFHPMELRAIIQW